MTASSDEARDEVGLVLEKKEESKKTELIQLISVDPWNNDKIVSLVPEWGRLIGEGGYRHNGENLGEHTQTVVKETLRTARESGLSETDTDLAVFAAFWHDFGQNTGKVGESVERIYDHENKSVEIMRKYAEEWGMDGEEILKVENVILLDGVVSDIARGRVRNSEKNLSVSQFAEKFGEDVVTLRILRAVNQADVLATVGEGGWSAIKMKYEKFFDDVELVITGEEKAKEMEARVEKKFNRIDLGEEVDPMKKLYLDSMEIVDKVRFRCYLGKEDTEIMARFSRIMRGERYPFEVDRYLGSGHSVDEEQRVRFLNFVRDYQPDKLRSLIRAVGKESADYLFTVSFLREERGLRELINDPELLAFSEEVSKVWSLEMFGIYGNRDPDRLEKLLKLRPFIFGNVMLGDKDVFDRVDAASHYLYPETAGPVLSLPNFPVALEYFKKGGVVPAAYILPVVELASTNRDAFEVAKKYLESRPANEIYIADLTNMVIESIENSTDNRLKKLLSMANENFKDSVKTFGNSPIGLSLHEKNMRGVSLLAGELAKQQLSDEMVEVYLDSFPFRTMGDDEIGYVIRNSEKLLGRLSQVSDPRKTSEILSEFGKKGIFAMILADDLMINGVNTFDEALVLARDKLQMIGNLDGFDTVTWKLVGQNIIKSPEKLSEILEMIAQEDVRQVILPGGLLFGSQYAFFASVFESNDFKANALRVAQQFLSPQTTYAEKVYFYAMNSNLEALDTRAPMVFVIHGDGGADLRALSLEQKKEVLRATIEKEVEMSKSKVAKQEADRRNRSIKNQDQQFAEGVRLHGTLESNLPAILRGGNLAGECVVRSNVVDSFPFCVDYAAVTSKDVEIGGGNFAGVFNSLNEKEDRYFGSYFDNGIALIMTPNIESEFTGIKSGHVLKFAAERATNIQGIVMTKRYQYPEVVSDFKMQIAQNGFYIPIYNPAGELLLEPEEYDRLRSENHLDIELEHWDESLEVGGKRGSNPGGLYAVPSTVGVEMYYAKFLGSRDRIWNEWLANKMYAEFGVAVPEVTVRNVGGRLAVTSKWIDSENDVVGELGDINNGFIMDAWLANWDIPWAMDANTKELGGGRVRLDNGGAILFRANAGMKNLDGGETPFTNDVVELTEYGTGKFDGSGMRAQYSGLTDNMVREQALKLGEIFTDQKIEELVEQTQISPELRKILITRLRGRRDYILNSVGLGN